MAYQYLKLDYLDTMSGGDPDTRRELLQMLARELETVLPTIRRLLEQENWGALRQFCHHLKTTLPFVGNPTLTNANRSMERSLQEKKKRPALEVPARQMERIMPLVLKELRRELRKAD